MEDADEPPVEAPGSVVVAGDPAGVTGRGGESRNAGEPFGGLKDFQVSAGGAEERSISGLCAAGRE